MTGFEKTTSELFELQKFAIKLGLENISFLSRSLGNPHLQYPVIHIAGTNGKGSVSYYISRILQAAGLGTGLYTSPHLTDYRERIRVEDRLISEEYIIGFWERMKSMVLQRQATFFDTTTALAFKYFADLQVDVAVIETGLGGRLDSTNIVQPEISVITPIDFDHEKQLGHTLKEIAREKAGIIKAGGSVFSAAQQAEVLRVLQDTAEKAPAFFTLNSQARWKKTSPPSLSGQDFTVEYFSGEIYHLKTRQAGSHQVENIILALSAARHFLQKRNLILREETVQEALSSGFWAGRLQVMQEQPLVIFDVSHNLHGMTKTINELREITGKQKINVLIGLVDDKDFRKIAELIAEFADTVIITEPDTSRKLSASRFAEEFLKLNKTVEIESEPLKAYQTMIASASPDEINLAIGSHYLIGELMRKINFKNTPLNIPTYNEVIYA